jgi:hypothetical protein
LAIDLGADLTGSPLALTILLSIITSPGDMSIKTVYFEADSSCFFNGSKLLLVFITTSTLEVVGSTILPPKSLK